MGGTPVSRKVLEDVRLVITSIDLDGVTTTKEVPDVKLFDDRETTYDFQVPQRLASIQFQLRAKVQNQSHNQKVDLVGRPDVLAQRDRPDRQDRGLALRPHRQRSRRRRLRHRPAGQNRRSQGRPAGERHAQTARLHAAGSRVAADRCRRDASCSDRLPGVASVTANDPQGTSHTWNIRHDEHTYPHVAARCDRQAARSALHGQQGKAGPLGILAARTARRRLCGRSVRQRVASTAGCSISTSCRRAIIRCCSSKAARKSACGSPKGPRVPAM